MKKILTKVTAILAIVIGALGIIGGIIIAASSGGFATVYYSFSYRVDGLLMAVYIILGVLLSVFSIVQIILGAKLLKRLEDPNGLLIAVIILSLCGGNVFAMVLAIIALCMPSDVAGAVKKVKETFRGSSDEFSKSVSRLKQYLADGIITEEVYKKKIEELAKKNTDKMIEIVK